MDIRRLNLHRLLWAYDLTGRKLRRDEAAPGNCLATETSWLERPVLLPLNQDIGSWGCALVMALDTTGLGTGSEPMAELVSRYRTDMVGGYGAAINHFLRRVRELEPMRQKIQELEEAKPRL